VTAAVYAALPRAIGPNVGWLEGARARDARLSLVEAAAGIVGLLDPGGIAVFPAGLLRAPSEDAAQQLAERLRRAAAENDVALVFGIDLEDPRDDAIAGAPLVTLGFACDRARPLLWPARKIAPVRRRGRPPIPDEERVVALAGRRVGVVIGCEAFHPGLLRRVSRDAPELVVLMTHLGPTPRWRPALNRLSAIAPVVITGELSGALELPATCAGGDGGNGDGNGGDDGDGDDNRRRSTPPPLPFWAAAPAGWTRARVGCHAELELHAYSPIPASA
jgi:hypothetical protein